MEFRLIYTTILLLAGMVWCENDVSEDLQDLEKKLALKHYNESAFPALEDVQNTIQKKCEKNGGTHAYEKLERAKMDLHKCVQSNFNTTQIQDEVEKSKKTGSLDEVFAKYCLKTPIIQECISNLARSAEHCLEKEEKPSLKLMLNITESLANFVCYKDGDRLAMFVADGGFQCIQDKAEGLQKCVSDTLGQHVPLDLSLDNMPSLAINSERCHDYSNLQHCVVKVLETCEDKTPANIVGSLFKYIHKFTPCKSHKRVARSFNNQQELSGLQALFEELKEKYKPHCVKNGGPKAAEEFDLALGQVKICVNSTQHSFNTKMDEIKGIPFEYMCKNFRMGIRGCLDTLTTKMEVCSSAEEVYVPKFGMELYDSVFNFYCKDDARSLKKFLNERNMCVNRIHNSISFCLNKTKHIKVYAKDNVVTKNELCGDLKIVKHCFLDNAQRECGNEFVTGLSDAIYAPCSGLKVLATNLLMFSLMFILKFF